MGADQVVVVIAVVLAAGWLLWRLYGVVVQRRIPACCAACPQRRSCGQVGDPECSEAGGGGKPQAEGESEHGAVEQEHRF
ncbi:hypothetical protein LLH03_17210 [bacterium]|nr:hypothetical protein [bacterium]